MAQQGNVRQPPALPQGEAARDFWQRHWPNAVLVLRALALAAVVAGFLHASGAYATELDFLFVVILFVLTLRDRELGFIATLAVLAWPLFRLSPALMLLGLVPLLAARARIVEHLPWALLVVVSPVLAEWQLVALAPLLAGVLAGPRAGMWSGLIAALWLKLVAGLAGVAVPELGALHGVLLPLEQIATRAEIVGVRGVPALLLGPLGGSLSLFALHLLQVLAWGGAGWIAGQLRQLQWNGQAPGWPLVHVLAAPLLLLWGSIYLLPSVVGWQPWDTFLRYPGPTVGLAVAGLAAALVVTLHDTVQEGMSGRVRRRGYVETYRVPGLAVTDASADDDEEPLLLELE